MINETPGLSYLEATMELCNCPGNRIRRAAWQTGQFVEFGEDRLARVHGHGTVGGDPVLWSTNQVDIDATDYALLVNNPRPESPDPAAEQEAS